MLVNSGCRFFRGRSVGVIFFFKGRDLIFVFLRTLGCFVGRRFQRIKLALGFISLFDRFIMNRFVAFNGFRFSLEFFRLVGDGGIQGFVLCLKRSDAIFLTGELAIDQFHLALQQSIFSVDVRYGGPVLSLALKHQPCADFTLARHYFSFFPNRVSAISLTTAISISMASL